MRSIPRLLYLLNRRWRMVAFSVLMLICSVVADLAIPRLTQTVIDQGIVKHNMSVILRVSLSMIGVTMLSAAFSVGNTLLSVRVSQGAGAQLRGELFTHIQSLSFGNLDRLQTGQLMIRLTSDIMQILQFLQLMMRMFVRGPLMIIGSLILLFATSWQLALIMLVLMPTSMAVIWLFTTRTQPLFMEVQRRLGRLNTVLQENLAGVRVVKAFVRAPHETGRFDHANENLMSQTIRVGHLLASLLPLLRLITSLGTLAVIWLGGLQVMRAHLSVGQIVAFNNYVLSTMFPLTNLGMMVSFVASAGASTERVFEVLDSLPDVLDRPGAISMPPMRGRVVFEQVGFSYSGSNHTTVLRDISLEADPGQRVAILGATGSGKSTLVNLIPRFYDVTSGKVMIDGLDVRDVTVDSLRQQVGVVLQESVLFGGTIRDNIRYGHPGATDQEVIAAAQAAQADEFVRGFPNGYDSVVGQRGVNLSGGQKQRLAIARALLIDPRVLILDDSTSSVDMETEARIQQALDLLMTGRTTFVIAQRISTVLGADRIIVLDQGRVAAVGTHHELMASSPIYREIYESQLGNGEKGQPHGC